MSTCQLIGEQPQQSKVLLITIITVGLPGGKMRWGREHPDRRLSPLNLTGFKCLTSRWVQGQAEPRTGPRVLFLPPPKKMIYDTFFLPLSRPSYTLLLDTSVLLFIYLSPILSHLSPSFLHPSFFQPVPPPSLPSSLQLHLSYLSPFSPCSPSTAPQRFFKLLLHFNGRFLFTLQVKQCN